MEPVRFVVLGEPRGQGRVQSRIIDKPNGVRFVSHYTDPVTRAEQSAIRLVASRAMDGRNPITGPIELRMCAYRSAPLSWSQKKRAAALEGDVLPITRPDFDNTLKLVDALKGICWIDDAQITDCHYWKRYSDRPRLSVEIRPL